MTEVRARLSTQVDSYEIYGYQGDYIFETLKKTKTFYEIATLQKWMTFIGNPRVIFDVGANLGNHTLYWVKHLSPEKVYAFEPYRPNYENLKLNIERNGLSDIVDIQMKAIGEAPGSVEIDKFDPSNFGGTTFRVSQEISETGFEMSSIDFFVKERGIDAIDLIKIDTEGFEVPVLKGALETIKKKRPVLWVEVSYDSYQDVLEILSRVDYELADIEAFNLLMIPRERNVRRYHVSNDKLLEMTLLFQTKATTYYKNYEMAKNWNEASQAKIAAMCETESKLREQIAASENNYQTAKSWNEASQAKVAELRETEAKLREQIATAENNYKTAKAWNEASIAKASALQIKLNEEQKKMLDAEKKMHEMETTIQNLTNDRENLTDQLDRTEKLCREQEKTIQVLTQELNEYADVFQRYLDIAPESLDLAQKLMEKLEEQKSTQDSFAALIGEFISESMENENLISQIQAQISKLQAQASYLKKENSAYREKIDKIRSVWYGRLGIAVYKKGQKLRSKIKSLLKK